MQEFQCIFSIITSLAPAQLKSTWNWSSLSIIQLCHWTRPLSKSLASFFKVTLVYSFFPFYLLLLAAEVINVIEGNKLLAPDARIAYLERKVHSHCIFLKGTELESSTLSFRRSYLHHNHFLPKNNH